MVNVGRVSGNRGAAGVCNVGTMGTVKSGNGGTSPNGNRKRPGK